MVFDSICFSIIVFWSAFGFCPIDWCGTVYLHAVLGIGSLGW